MAFRIRRKKGINALRVGLKIGSIVLALYVGGFFINTLGSVMTNTSSPFYTGLRMLGWTVGYPLWNTTNYSISCGGTSVGRAIGDPTGLTATCLTNTDPSTSILAVVGIIAVATVVFEFVEVSF